MTHRKYIPSSPKKINFYFYLNLTPKGPKAIFRPLLKFGHAIVKAIFIKNS
jgi:hypothetical protein